MQYLDEFLLFLAVGLPMLGIAMAFVYFIENPEKVVFYLCRIWHWFVDQIPDLVMLLTGTMLVVSIWCFFFC